MKKRISKRVREEAALICAVGASNPDVSECYSAVCFALGVPQDDEAAELAHQAWKVVDRASVGRSYKDLDPTVDAEAEALLRTGWSPE